MLLTDFLENNVEKASEAPALTMRMGYRTITLNYRQVYELSCKIAVFLQQRGIGKDDKVVIFAPNSPFWVCVFLGSMLNGSIAVPVNTQSTSQMLKKIIDHTGARIVFKSRQFKRDPIEGVDFFEIELIDELTENIDLKLFKKANVTEDDLVEILYTSGTTGNPKGVMLSHKNIYSNVFSMAKILNIKPESEVLLSVLPLTHILEQNIGLFLVFYFSAHIVYTHSYAAIPELLQEFKVSKVVAVPEILKVLMDRIKSEAEKKGKLKLLQKMLDFAYKFNCKILSKILFHSIRKKLGGRLDTVASGGAPLDQMLEMEWMALGMHVIQGYGLTETSPVIASNTFDKHRFASVGQVLEGVQVKINADGEIWTKGPNVFKGYFSDEAKTKSAFTQDGWFMTGDMGYLDKDGFLFLRGRKKYMILGSGGQNVFPEDIEEEINKIAGVKDSCVLGLEKLGTNTQIHAVLLLIDQSQSLEQIIDLANQNLASYQQINSWEAWPEDDFPRSATRKVKRDDVLKFILANKGASIVNNIQPRSKVCGILSLVSGVDALQISPNTRIIRDLNMDSLMRVELVIRIEQEFGFSIDEAFVSQTTTVDDLEKAIAQRKFLVQKIKLKKWVTSWWAKILRIVGQLFICAASKIFMKVEVEGLKNIENLKMPIVLMPNHISYFDPLAIMCALPINVRKSLSFAAAQDVLYEEFKNIAWLAELFFNSFSFPRSEDANIRTGLDSMGTMLDKGYSVVVFPEGKISVDGIVQSLKLGAGLMAVEMNVPIIPIKIEGADKIAPYCSIIPRHRSVVKIKFGKPLKFKKADSYESARIKVENAIRCL